MSTFQIDPLLTLSDDDKDQLRSNGTAGIINVLAAHSHHFARDVFNSLYYFENNNWVRGGEDKASKLCCDLLDSLGSTTIKWTPERDRALLRRLRVTVPYLWADPPPSRYLSLLNGIFDLDKRKIVAEVPKVEQWLWPIQLPIIFDPKAKCQHWDKFIKEVFPPDAIELAWQIPCWLIIPGLSSEQRSLVFTGIGSNGKTVCLDAYTRFLGQNNVTDFPLHELQTNRFASRYLHYKLVNICPELPSRKIETEFFKNLVGQGNIMAELKGGAIKRIRPFCKIICSTNGAVRSHDDTDAFYRRLLPVAFNNKFAVVPGMREKLIANLSSQNEMSGLFNRCIEIYPSLISKGLATPTSSQELIQDFQRLNSPIHEWAKLVLMFQLGAEGLTPEVMYDNYYQWRQMPDQYRRFGEVKEIKGIFCRNLVRLFPNLKPLVVRRGGVVTRIYADVRFRLIGEIDSEAQPIIQ